REYLLARWPRPAQLRERVESRLSRRVRHAVYFFAAVAGRESDLGLDLYVGRSADRFRDTRGVMSLAPPSDPLARNKARPPATGDVGAPDGTVPLAARRSRLSPLNQRRWRNFKANRRGYWSLWIFTALFVVSLFAELIANDRPLLLKYDGKFYVPV